MRVLLQSLVYTIHLFSLDYIYVSTLYRRAVCGSAVVGFIFLCVLCLRCGTFCGVLSGAGFRVGWSFSSCARGSLYSSVRGGGL